MTDIKDELERRKKELMKHFEKFKKLKNENKQDEALKQLNITLNYANQTLEYSSNIIKNIMDKNNQTNNVEIEEDEKDCEEVMIVIPKNQTMH